MPTNYYIVLGIDRGADLSQIKRAYRKAIKRYHPDTIRQGTDPDKFMEAREAYEVLSDTDQRRAHDERLRHQGVPIRVPEVKETIGRRTAQWHSLRDSASFIDDFFEGIVPGFYHRHTRPSAAHKDLYLEVILTPEEAANGGIFPITVPVLEPCATCHQSGWWDHFYCPSCLGHGAVRSTRHFNLTIPPRTPNGLRNEVALDRIGLTDTRLVIDVKIADDPFP
jgi:molecular chaperone DnaJ